MVLTFSSAAAKVAATDPKTILAFLKNQIGPGKFSGIKINPGSEIITQETTTIRRRHLIAGEEATLGLLAFAITSDDFETLATRTLTPDQIIDFPQIAKTVSKYAQHHCDFPWGRCEQREPDILMSLEQGGFLWTNPCTAWNMAAGSFPHSSAAHPRVYIECSFVDPEYGEIIYTDLSYPHNPATKYYKLLLLLQIQTRPHPSQDLLAPTL